MKVKVIQTDIKKREELSGLYHDIKFEKKNQSVNE